MCDDGSIEKGVGHVHAAFTELEPEGINEGMAVINQEMLEEQEEEQKLENFGVLADHSSQLQENLWNSKIKHKAVVVDSNLVQWKFGPRIR